MWSNRSHRSLKKIVKIKNDWITLHCSFSLRKKIVHLWKRLTRSIWSRSIFFKDQNSKDCKIGDQKIELGTLVGSLFFGFSVNSLFIESERLRGAIRSCHSFKKSNGSECHLIPRARIAMKSDSLFFVFPPCFPNSPTQKNCLTLCTVSLHEVWLLSTKSDSVSQFWIFWHCACRLTMCRVTYFANIQGWTSVLFKRT